MRSDGEAGRVPIHVYHTVRRVLRHIRFLDAKRKTYRRYKQGRDRKGRRAELDGAQAANEGVERRRKKADFSSGGAARGVTLPR